VPRTQANSVGARCEFKGVNRSVLVDLSTRICCTLSKASSVNPVFPPECRPSEYRKLGAQIRVHGSVFRAVANRCLPLTPLACAHPVPRRVCLRVRIILRQQSPEEVVG